jgi:hypothetical protein
MPLQISSEELSAIVRCVEGYPDGASVGDLLAAPGLDFARRTLQRRLEQLVGEGRLVAEGAGRGRRYLVAKAPRVASEDAVPYRVTPDWLSPAAREIRTSVKRPLRERKPVSYHSEFLADYEPNVTAWLDEPTRRDLAERGQVGLTDLPAGTYLRHVLSRLLIDLSWNSSRLEGNTYSLLETERLLERGEGADGKGAKESQMILNHKAAIEMLADQAGEIGFNRYTICNLHALLSDNLLTDLEACGRVRSRPVGISGTVYLPLAVPQQLEERFDEILQKAEAINDPFEQSFFVMVQLPYLQPFEDVNKRVSRLAANIPLVKKNLCPLSFIDVPQDDYLNALIGVYELNRVDYLRDLFVWAYGRSAERYSAVRGSLGDPDPFRLRHRAEIGAVVREIVQGALPRAEATALIATAADDRLPAADRARFREVLAVELRSLHMGNIARFRLRPTEFEAWQEVWAGSAP